jgi:hypothetical protein
VDDHPLRGALDTGTAHVARVYDYWLGGKDNVEADQRYGDDLQKRVASIRTTAQMNLRRSETRSCWSGCVSVFVDDAAEHSRS